MEVYVIYERTQQIDYYDYDHWITNNLLIPFYITEDKAKETISLLNKGYDSPKEKYKVGLCQPEEVEIDRYFTLKVEVI